MQRVHLVFISLLVASAGLTLRAGDGSSQSHPEPELPADVIINKDAGRGNLLFLTLRLESGEELPFVVDTGSSGTLLDKSLEPRLGKRVGTMTMHSWGTTKQLNTYAAPKLYLGSTPLITDNVISTYDFTSLASGTGHRVLGMLSMDCLRHYCVQLDFEAEKMRFLRADDLKPEKLGKAFPIEIRSGGRPFIHHVSLTGNGGTNSLIDSGFDVDGRVDGGTNTARKHLPQCVWDGETYTNLIVGQGQGANILGLRFLARHLVTLDFPHRTMYLLRRSVGPLPGSGLVFNSTRVEALEPLIKAVIRDDLEAARLELANLEKSNAPELQKSAARNLVAALQQEPKRIPARAPPGLGQLYLGDAQPEIAEVGWLEPAANRIPRGDQIESPLLDSGKIYATGLYAHSPSRYVFDLGGKWETLYGEAGLHTAFQPFAAGVVFVIKTDGKEIFRSPVIRGATLAKYKVDVSRAKKLELVVENAAKGNGGNWGLWLEPTLLRQAGNSATLKSPKDRG